ncbi:hypothetical protein DIPPA_24868 [Diplonema papillatum]|nr:hypothetical protein DIPPA_24868 [Diplonema papillatum]
MGAAPSAPPRVAAGTRSRGAKKLRQARLERLESCWRALKSPAYISDNFHQLQHRTLYHLRSEERKHRCAPLPGPEVEAKEFQRLFVAAGKLQEARTARDSRQLEKDYWVFDPHSDVSRLKTSAKKLFGQPQDRQISQFKLPLKSAALRMPSRDGLGDAGEDGRLLRFFGESRFFLPSKDHYDGTPESWEYYLKREARFFESLLPVLQKAGYRVITKRDVSYAKIHSFAKHRFNFGWQWLNKGMIDRVGPQCFIEKSTLSDEERQFLEESEVFHGRVLMFARGEGTVSAKGFFYLDKIEAITHRITDMLYYHIIWKHVPTRILRWSDPDVTQWARVYEGKLKTTTIPEVSDRVDLDDQLQYYAFTSFAKLLGRCELREPTFKSVVVLFRRNRPSEEANSTMWRATGPEFNRMNIEIAQYINVPKTDIQLLLPEKTMRQKGVDYLSILSMSGVLGWTIAKAAFQALSFSQVLLLGVASGYLARIIARWRFSQIRYTHTVDSLRARNHMTNGIATLRMILTSAAAQSLKQAMLVYLVLMKERNAGRDTAWWDSAELSYRIAAELETLGSQADGHYMLNVAPEQWQEKVTSENGLAAYQLWSHNTCGTHLGLTPRTPAEALTLINRQWREVM